MTELSGERRTIALDTTGFMPEVEGDALFVAALGAGRACPGLSMVEIGSYCGRSTVWFGAAAEICNTLLFAVDHHGGQLQTAMSCSFLPQPQTIRCFARSMSQSQPLANQGRPFLRLVQRQIMHRLQPLA